ncbi:hypothetical protein LTR56_022782 [Elasticomyces elasticus]|nr:hypothetical protein LTR22_025396 [Elasticomyces elasticus]KAK3621449.1 hypothetical protein LTR56_022782 [Elasticomyces elasticus]KAK4904732.1 hypothetical protein LTR49_025868 [Elasticomyces elasticus]KAK5741245.1 hypothetical protein LTS12_024676 [Elasticomyces elasticus]
MADEEYKSTVQPLSTLISAIPPPADLAEVLRSGDPVVDLEKLSQEVTANVERLAAWYERTKKPYAHRKAGTLRRANTNLIALISKLAGILEKELREEEEVARREAADFVGLPGALHSHPVITGLAETSTFDPEQAQREDNITDEAGAAQSQALNEVQTYHVPTSPPSEETSDNEKQPEALPGAIAAQHTQDAATSTQLPTYEAQVTHIVSRLVIAKQILHRTAPAMAEAVGAFGLACCEAPVWYAWVQHYASHELDGSVVDARAYLNDAAGVLGALDRRVADDLLRIISGL